MDRSRWLLVLFVAVILTLSFAVPTKDMPETPYDESQSAPYVSTRVVSNAITEPVVKVALVSTALPEPVAEASAVRLCDSRHRLGFLRRPGEQPLDRRMGWPHSVSDSLTISLTILDHSLRC
jgi:type IV secretory pathway protease TraF